MLPKFSKVMGHCTNLINGFNSLKSFVRISEADTIGVHGQAVVVAHAAQQVEVLFIVPAELPLADELAGCGAFSCTFSHAIKYLEVECNVQ